VAMFVLSELTSPLAGCSLSRHTFLHGHPEFWV
jgi:hypothetical protein